ncbi:MAG: hypothetical protein IT307_08830 [Chloroflexi bacterium]|nr:hypothetical protein [Chloroflexota bacterium]
MWQVFEPYHAITFFAPETRAATEALGLRGGWMGYFAARSAALGAVPVEVVIATFYNFHPSLVRRALPEAWSRTTPEAVLAARLESAGQALRRLLGEASESVAVAEAAALAREAAEACDSAGRALFAAHAELPWPEEPYLVLWSAATRLREHRGDGHVASLLAAEIDPCEAHVTLAATGRVSAEAQRTNRWWSDEAWQAATERLQARGWLDEHAALTEAGRAGREAIEIATDRLAMRPWRALGPERSARLWTLWREISGRIVEGGGLLLSNQMGLGWPPAAYPG